MARSYEARQQYYVTAPPSKVFRALTEPRGLVSWFLSAAEIALTARGKFAFDWSQGYHMDGKVLSIRAPTAVAFLWRDRLPSGRMVETRAAFTLLRKGRGTLLKLRHSGFHDPEHFAECSARWAYYLTNLKSVLDHGVDLRSPADW